MLVRELSVFQNHAFSALFELFNISQKIRNHTFSTKNHRFSTFSSHPSEAIRNLFTAFWTFGSVRVSIPVLMPYTTRPWIPAWYKVWHDSTDKSTNSLVIFVINTSFDTIFNIFPMRRKSILRFWIVPCKSPFDNYWKR